MPMLSHGAVGVVWVSAECCQAWVCKADCALVGALQAMKQVKSLGKWFSASFLFSFFKWFFSYAPDGANCSGALNPILALLWLQQ